PPGLPAMTARDTDDVIGRKRRGDEIERRLHRLVEALAQGERWGAAPPRARPLQELPGAHPQRLEPRRGSREGRGPGLEPAGFSDHPADLLGAQPGAEQDETGEDIGVIVREADCAAAAQGDADHPDALDAGGAGGSDDVVPQALRLASFL